MPTDIATIITEAETLLDKEFKAAAPATLTDADALIWMKAAYDVVSGIIKQPRKRATVNSVASQNEYALPTDCWMGFSGIVAVIIDDVPLKPGRTFQDLMEVYGEDWKNPSAFDTPEYFIEWIESAKYALIPAPGAAGTANIEVIYVQDVAKPTATTDTLPTEFEPFRSIFPLYLVGRAAQKDGETNFGAAIIAEFEGRIRKQGQRKNRVGPRILGEGMTLKLRNYKTDFRQARRKSGY